MLEDSFICIHISAWNDQRLWCSGFMHIFTSSVDFKASEEMFIVLIGTRQSNILFHSCFLVFKSPAECSACCQVLLLELLLSEITKIALRPWCLLLKRGQMSPWKPSGMRMGREHQSWLLKHKPDAPLSDMLSMVGFHLSFFYQCATGCLLAAGMGTMSWKHKLTSSFTISTSIFGPILFKHAFKQRHQLHMLQQRQSGLKRRAHDVAVCQASWWDAFILPFVCGGVARWPCCHIECQVGVCISIQYEVIYRREVDNGGYTLTLLGLSGLLDWPICICSLSCLQVCTLCVIRSALIYCLNCIMHMILLGERQSCQ